MDNNVFQARVYRLLKNKISKKNPKKWTFFGPKLIFRALNMMTLFANVFSITGLKLLIKICSEGAYV